MDNVQHHISLRKCYCPKPLEDYYIKGDVECVKKLMWAELTKFENFHFVLLL